MNEVLDGNAVAVNTRMFENRLDQVDIKDKVLTVLVHLGYLSFDPSSLTARMPNQEVRLQTLNAFAKSLDKAFVTRVNRCENVLHATYAMDCELVASLFEEIHGERLSIHYNDKQTLRYVVLTAYNNSPNVGYSTFEELSSGKGYVVMFKPLAGYTDPVIVVGLKHNSSAKAVLAQIHEKDYTGILKKDGYQGEVLLYLDAQICRILHPLPAVICGTIVNICSRPHISFHSWIGKIKRCLLLE